MKAEGRVTTTLASLLSLLAVACASRADPSPASSGAVSPVEATLPAGASLASEAGAAVPALDSARVDAIRMAYTALSGSQAPVFIAQEGGYFRQYGLDVDLTLIPGSSLAVQAMIANELQAGVCSGSAVVAARVGGADVKIIAGLSRVPAFSILARPPIRRLVELRGQRVGIDRRGTSRDTASRLALRHGGLEPDRDVIWVNIGGTTVDSLAALESGAIDASAFGLPFHLEAQRRGYVELLDLSAEDIPYQGSCVMAREEYMATSSDVARKLVRAVADAIHRYKTDQEFSLTVLRQYTTIEDQEILRATWRYYAERIIPDVPYATLRGLETVIEEVAVTNPQAAGYRPEDFVEHRFVRELEEAGYFVRLYGR